MFGLKLKGKQIAMRKSEIHVSGTRSFKCMNKKNNNYERKR